jgi:hypothetical protein
VQLQKEMESHYQFSSEVKGWLSAHETRAVNSNKWGDTQLPVLWLVSPDKDIAARSLNERHVQDVVDSLQKFGIQVHRVKILIWVHELRALGIEVDNIDFSNFNPKGPAPCKMQVIAGDHTIAAVKRMMVMRPANPLWQSFSVRIVVAEENDVNKRFVQAVGSIDNKVAEVSKGATTWDNISQIHYKKEAIDQDTSKTAADKKTAFAAYRAICNTTMGGPGGNAVSSLGNLFAIANHKGQLWENISTIFQMDAAGTLSKSDRKVSKGTIKPLNQGPFCHMANLPESDLIRWTQKVIDNEWAPSEFKTRCLAVKKVHKLQDYILKHFEMRFSEKFRSFVEAAQKYEFLTDKQWIASLLPAFNPTRRDVHLPQSIATSLENKLKAHVKKATQQLSTQVLKFLFCFYFLFFLYRKQTSLFRLHFHTHDSFNSHIVFHLGTILFRLCQRLGHCSKQSGQEMAPL